MSMPSVPIPIGPDQATAIFRIYQEILTTPKLARIQIVVPAAVRDPAIVVLGNSIALYNPPTRVAEEMAMLDVMSGGRLISGFPVGTSMDTNYCYGQIPSLTREKYQEAHDLIIKAWTTREPFAFNGRYNKLRHVNIWPRPIQQPHPPIFVVGTGSPSTMAYAAEITVMRGAASRRSNTCACFSSFPGTGMSSQNLRIPA